MTELATTILIPIFGKCLEMEQSGNYENLQKHASVTYIGIGSSNTLHGTSDMRINGCPMLLSCNWSEHLEEEDDDTSETRSTSSSVSVEAKRLYTPAHLDQVIATSITATFTFFNASGHSCVPTILINNAKYYQKIFY